MLKNKLPAALYDLTLRYKSLRPCQKKAIKAGLLEGQNLVICSPTGSGKTFCAELAGLKAILEGKGKFIYTVPLKALANQKFSDFKNYEKLGVKVALSTGDLDSADPFLARYDLIICSNEKLDSLIRHQAAWLEDIAVICFDEIHLLDDPTRGPTLEILITELRQILPKAQFLALSATVGNPIELAGWLKAKLVLDSWRPVKLYEGTAFKHEADFYGSKPSFSYPSATGNDTIDLALETINEKKQALIFVNTRKSAEALAEKIALNLKPNSEGKALAAQALKVLSTPSRQCKKLAKVLEKGIAFHHAGLPAGQRVLVEKAFQEGKLGIICCTPTLALGLEFPSDRVIVKDLKRYGGFGMQWIPTLEAKQFIGRCGRPTYHSYGEAFYIAKTSSDKKEIEKRYVKGKPEVLTSKLAVEPVLRMHLLSLIATSLCKTEQELKNFFSQTFWAAQFGKGKAIWPKIAKVEKLLLKWNFIVKQNSRLEPTRLGLRIAQLYIDPLSAHQLLIALEKAVNQGINELGILQTACSCVELFPLLRVKQKEWQELETELLKHENQLYETPQPYEIGYERFMASFKTALALKAWLNEASEEQILEKYDLTPGELFSKIQNCDWLLYSAEQLSILQGWLKNVNALAKLRVRLKYGVKPELLPLLRFKGIGRIRARILFNAGIKDRRGVKKASLEALASLIGKAMAEKLKEQVS